MIEISQDEAHILFVDAARYAIGRGTYIADSTARVVFAHIDELSPKTAFVIARDVRSYVEEAERMPARLRANYDLDVKPYVDLLPALDARAGEGE